MLVSLRRLVFAAVLLLLASTNASAVTYGFSCISNNLAGDCAIGSAQLSVDVTAVGLSQVLFTFSNVGASNSSIADVYFDDGSLFGIASLYNTPGLVAFSLGASPGNLPAANNVSPPFQTTAGFSTDSDAPVQPNGVNPGETLGVLFNIIGGQSYADVINQLNTATLRIGIHVQGYATMGSESFVNVVPEPSTALLIALGLGWLGSKRRPRFA